MLSYILFIAGIILLIKGADYLVEGSSSLAKKFGMPTLVIGLTIVAFGTSMPELVVNVVSALRGASDIAFGNVIGSNIANIFLVLGITAFIHPIRVQHSTVWKEVPFSLLAVFVLLVFSNIFYTDGIQINSLLRSEGIIMIFFLIIFGYYVYSLAQQNKSHLEDNKIEVKIYKKTTTTAMIIGGLVGLYFGGEWTVGGAVAIAKLFNLSEFFISATIIAIGTSLPELVTCVIAARKGDSDLVVGNVVGSNIFNIFWILGVTSIIAPLTFPASATFDLLALVVATVLLFLFMFVGKKHHIDRWQGIFFLILYVTYIGVLIYRG